jgi:cyanophycinase-like exopeptidase
MRDVAIDTHFIARGRIWRMAQAIATNPQCIGIGLEEDTGILFTEGNQLEVVGSGLIVVVDGKGMTLHQRYGSRPRRARHHPRPARPHARQRRPVHPAHAGSTA